MKVFARHDLIAASLDSDDALLLEGSWPTDQRRWRHWSLDDEIEARCAWIDRVASEYALLAAQPGRFCQQTLNFAFINALSLRYFFVKLLRILAFFRDVRPLDPGESVELHLASQADEPYADLFYELVAARRATLNVHWHESPAAIPPRHRRAISWRQWAARARQWPLGSFDHGDRARPRVVLCGNPRILNPVCTELLARGARVWWLYERLAVRCWWRWRRAGVEQLVCETEVAAPRSFSDVWPGSELRFEDIDLAKPVERWLGQRAAELGAPQSLIIERVESHFRKVRPTALILDEDGTPLKRIAAALAQRHGAWSAVVQHGAPCGRFGFAPLAADRICVWGESSRRQLKSWGIADERISKTGWPTLKRQLLTFAPHVRSDESRGARFLLLATVPPRDNRPDGVEFHLTTKNHADMLNMVGHVLGQIVGATLTVKLHPRCRTSDFARHELGSTVPVRIVHSADLAMLLAQTDCVISCASTAGIEAALAGAPVVQLLPSGSGDVLPAEEWGFVGSARTADELAALATKALERGWRKDTQPAATILTDYGRSAAARIVDDLLGASGASESRMTTAAALG